MTFDSISSPLAAQNRTALHDRKQMGDQSLAEIAESADEMHGAKPAYRVLYDGQCEICQACVSWLKALDRQNKTICLPISANGLLTVDGRLNLDECLRQLHVVPPVGEIQ